ncbi:MAG: hypothetical protein NVS3B28_11020 [Candidatus Velthaea sp.]
MNFRLFTSGVVAALFVTAGAAQAASRVHTFTSASISPDGASVVSVESIEGAPDAKTSPSPSIVIRPRGGGSSSTISCPSAAACTLGSPVWSPQGKRLAYLVRDMKTRNYAVWTSDAAGGNRKPWLAAYKGVLNAPRWSADGSTLALLATAGAHKDIGATQAGAALVGEIGAVKTADVQRIATLGSGGTLTYASPVDDARLGVTGFSYGGYMTMWTVTQTNRFKAAAAGAGIANWQSYVGENGIDTWVLPFFGSSVYDDPAVYAKSSPMTFIKNVKTPTFVFVGERDVECPAPQSQEFWHALDKLGVPTSLVIYAGEGHGIRRADHKRDITARTIAWFDRYLN